LNLPEIREELDEAAEQIDENVESALETFVFILKQAGDCMRRPF
jgi:hypothetical protein